MFKRIGILAGMSLVQGGSGYPFFAPSFYKYISGCDICTISPDAGEIPDADLRVLIAQV